MEITVEDFERISAIKMALTNYSTNAITAKDSKALYLSAETLLAEEAAARAALLPLLPLELKKFAMPWFGKTLKVSPPRGHFGPSGTRHTGNARKHAFGIRLGLELRLATGYAIMPYEIINILERFLSAKLEH
ncbi:Uu.00g013460.m01.CDS01 [Anthostomella pinea]|uniref:Uu.00g013460.m01.CDS01 n=1 Tax=Anthostomella pinea TaxID=933095 RepID=A0AAI8VY71_9PEZI|nr:Uu.00g013460.m01.CDS01 [Anthostomella pinea]